MSMQHGGSTPPTSTTFRSHPPNENIMKKIILSVEAFTYDGIMTIRYQRNHYELGLTRKYVYFGEEE